MNGDPPQIATGRLVQKNATSITLQSASGEVRLVITPNTNVWKGSNHDPLSALKIGDEITAEYTYVADARQATFVWADLVNVYGEILDVNGHRLVVLTNPNANPHSGYAKHRVIVEYGPSTEFATSKPQDLRQGRTVQVTGVQEAQGRRILASKITIYEGAYPTRMMSDRPAHQ